MTFRLQKQSKFATMKKNIIYTLTFSFVMLSALVGEASNSAKAIIGGNTYFGVKDSVYLVADQMPEFQGGRRGMSAYFNQKLRYPEAAKQKKLTGKVYVKFVVDVTGKVKDVSIVRKKDPLLDAEAIRIVKQMPTWKPGTDKGEAVNVSQIVTISFPPKR